jgi:SAM-dependent methyltransferase
MPSVTSFHRGAHVPEADLHPEATACPVCGAGGERPQRLELQDEPRVVLRECLRCSAVSASRMPTDDALARYYQGYYDANASGVTVGDTERWAGLWDATLAAHLAGPHRDTLRILDFGGGNGAIAQALAHRWTDRHRAIELCVVDLEADPVASVRPEVTITGAPTVAEADGRFDVVIASAIIEHVPDPAGTLRELLGRMTPGGVLYVRTPYVVPLLRIVGRVIDVDFTFPAHLHDLGRDFWDGVPGWLQPERPVDVVLSRPSAVETTLAAAPGRTVAAHVLKAPSRLSRRWPFVAGWEAVLRVRP